MRIMRRTGTAGLAVRWRQREDARRRSCSCRAGEDGARVRVIIANPVRLLRGRARMAENLLVSREDGPVKRDAVRGRTL
jgi:hypothetical protein